MNEHFIQYYFEINIEHKTSLSAETWHSKFNLSSIITSNSRTDFKKAIALFPISKVIVKDIRFPSGTSREKHGICFFLYLRLCLPN